MHSGNGAVPLYPGLELHQYWMAAAVAVKYFFASQADFDRTVQQQSGFGNHNFVIERIAFSAKAAAVR